MGIHKEEEEYLAKKYVNTSNKTLAKRTNRSVHSVKHKLENLNFQKRNENMERVNVIKKMITNLNAAANASAEKAKPKVNSAKDKVGRNDPCPCGSGKKYKQCCGK